MHEERKKAILERTRRIVVKLGSSILTTASGVDQQQVGRLSAELARLVDDGFQIVVVTSGARAAGLSRLGLKRLPKNIAEQQAAAAIGQIRLMAFYERFFSDFHKHIGQVLLTAADLQNRTRYLNAKRTFEHLLRHGVVPIVNENDSVAIDELKFGDNDRLSALVAGLVDADLLVMLSDVDGLHESDPRLGQTPLVEMVDDIDAWLGSGAAGASGSAVGTGGMKSKLLAARSAAHRGIPSIVASGVKAATLARIVDPDDHTGTLFAAREITIPGRKHWIAYGLALRGDLLLDAGAAEALTDKGGSLLAAGITGVRGQFSRGDAVRCLAPSGTEIARGLVAYDSGECAKLCGQPSANILRLLGYHAGDEVIHRDDLVLLADAPTTAVTRSDDTRTQVNADGQRSSKRHGGEAEE